MGPVADDVKRDKRRYHSPRRLEQGAATRRAILEAARELFVSRGYAATTVTQIAATAAVNVDTLYATVGRKPDLLRTLVETALSGTDEVVPGRERDYVVAIRAASGAAEKVAIYAGAVTAIQQRLGPIFVALRDAAVADEACRLLWSQIAERRARNMLELAADLRRTGQLRADLSDREVADVLWSMNASEYWVLLVGERHWTADRFSEWLADAWQRLLLASTDEQGRVGQPRRPAHRPKRAQDS